MDHSSSQIVTTNKPTPRFYRPDALPVTRQCQKHWNDKVSLSKLTWGFFPTLSLTTKCSYLPWGGGEDTKPLVSPLTPVPQSINQLIIFILKAIRKAKGAHRTDYSTTKQLYKQINNITSLMATLLKQPG